MNVTVASNPACFGNAGDVITSTITVQNVDVMPPYVPGVGLKMNFNTYPVASQSGTSAQYQENDVPCALPQSPGQTTTCTHSYTIRPVDVFGPNVQVKLDYYVYWLRLANLQAGNPIIGQDSGQKILWRNGHGACTSGGTTTIPGNSGLNGPDVNFLSGNGLTFVAKQGGANEGWVLLGTDYTITDPYDGDAPPNAMHRIACVRPTTTSNPASYDAMFDPANWRTQAYARWKQGEVALTRETHTAQNVTKTYANQQCQTDLGPGWFWLAFHFDNGQWNHGLTIAQGTPMGTWPVTGTSHTVLDLLEDPSLFSLNNSNPPESRFFIYIRDQN